MNRRNRVSPSANEYHGLFNQGATCYLNSVLQVLFMTKDFREAVERLPSENLDTKCIDPALKTLFGDLKRGTAHTSFITKTLGINRVYEQRDAAEYFEKILSHTSPEASRIFRGLLTHKDKCSKCGTETNTEGPFWNLPIALGDSENQEYYSVVDGIKKFFKVSEVSGEDQIYCDNCDAKTDSTNTFVIQRHPEVLMLLLKRFKFCFNQRRHVKTACKVEIPYTLQMPENQTYELYAFVEHFGSLKGGHYTATIKSQNNNDEKWYNFNDSSVTLLHHQPFQELNNEKSRSAYLLFYRKTTNPAADTVTQDISEVSTAKHEHQEDKHKHHGLKPETDERKVVIDDKEGEESITGADEWERAAGSGGHLTTTYHECQESRKAVNSQHDMQKNDQEQERAEEQSSGKVQGLEFTCVENKEDEDTVKGEDKKDEGHQDNSGDGDIQQRKANDQEYEKIYPKLSSVEKEREEKSDDKRNYEHSPMRVTSERHGGEDSEDRDSGQLNAGQSGQQEDPEQGVLHGDVDMETEIIDQKKTADDEHAPMRVTSERHGVEGSEGQDSGQLVAGRSGQQEDPEQGVLHADVDMETEIIDQKKTADDEHAPMRVTSERHGGDGSEDQHSGQLVAGQSGQQEDPEQGVLHVSVDMETEIIDQKKTADDEHAPMRVTSERDGGEGSEDHDRGQLNAGQSGHEEDPEQGVLHVGVDMETEIIDQKKTADDEHAPMRVTSERHGVEGSEDQDSGQLVAGQSGQQEDPEQGVLHVGVDMETEITDQKKTADDEHAPMRVTSERHGVEGSEDQDSGQLVAGQSGQQEDPEQGVLHVGVDMETEIIDQKKTADDEHAPMRVTSERDGGEGSEDQDRGQLNAGQSGQEEDPEQGVLHIGVDMETEITDQKKTADDEHAPMRVTSERHGVEGSEDQDSGQLVAGQSGQQEDPEQGVLHVGVDMETEITDQKKTADDEHAPMRVTSERHGVEGSEDQDSGQLVAGHSGQQEDPEQGVLHVGVDMETEITDQKKTADDEHAPMRVTSERHGVEGSEDQDSGQLVAGHSGQQEDREQGVLHVGVDMETEITDQKKTADDEHAPMRVTSERHGVEGSEDQDSGQLVAGHSGQQEDPEQGVLHADVDMETEIIDQKKTADGGPQQHSNKKAIGEQVEEEKETERECLLESDAEKMANLSDTQVQGKGKKRKKRIKHLFCIPCKKETARDSESE